MAGVSTKDIKNRIRSMESTRQITKAMEMVAASKLRHAQAQALNTRPYFETLYAAIGDLASSGGDSAYFQSPKGGKTVYVVIAGDRGLAGGYNSNVLKLALADMAERDVTVLPIGKKAVDFFRTKQISVMTDSYAQAAAVSIGDCFSVAKLLCKGFLSGEFDRVCVAYTEFVSVLSQTPHLLTLLPLTPEEQGSASGEILYEPSPEEVLSKIVPEYLGGVLYSALCESRASEQAARRTAMDSATQNADDMIADLSLKFNQARQAAITQEITEIVAGS
jgi:F-type H+-transporting ATPase subunit gamma